MAATLNHTMSAPLPAARVTALGLTFKAGTSDVRDSPALTVCGELARTGAQITGYDPQLARIDQAQLRRSSIVAVDDPYLASKDADAIVLLTEWPEFRELDWQLIADQAPGAVVVDTRNLLDAEMLADTGLTDPGRHTDGILTLRTAPTEVQMSHAGTRPLCDSACWMWARTPPSSTWWTHVPVPHHCPFTR